MRRIFCFNLVSLSVHAEITFYHTDCFYWFMLFNVKLIIKNKMVITMAMHLIICVLCLTFIDRFNLYKQVIVYR